MKSTTPIWWWSGWRPGISRVAVGHLVRQPRPALRADVERLLVLLQLLQLLQLLDDRPHRLRDNRTHGLTDLAQLDSQHADSPRKRL